MLLHKGDTIELFGGIFTVNKDIDTDNTEEYLHFYFTDGNEQSVQLKAVADQIKVIKP